jgi:hypothetical protein
MEYNAFGEMISKGVNGGRQEYFEYDNAGRIWRTNSGDGVDKVALYNLLGNQTAQIMSYGAASGNTDLRAFSNPDSVVVADLRRTDTVFDMLVPVAASGPVARKSAACSAKAPSAARAIRPGTSPETSTGDPA